MLYFPYIKMRRVGKSLCFEHNNTDIEENDFHE